MNMNMWNIISRLLFITREFRFTQQTIVCFDFLNQYSMQCDLKCITFICIIDVYHKYYHLCQITVSLHKSLMVLTIAMANFSAFDSKTSKIIIYPGLHMFRNGNTIDQIYQITKYYIFMGYIPYYNHYYDTFILYLRLPTLLPTDNCEALIFISIKIIMLVLRVLYEYELELGNSSRKTFFNIIINAMYLNIDAN